MTRNAAFLCLLLSFGPAIANPIAIDGAERPCRMTSEQIDIQVGSGISIVSGHYTFQQGEDDWPEIHDTHVTIFIPVLLPEHAREDHEKHHGSPIITIGNRSWKADYPPDDIRPSNFPKEISLPYGWRMTVYRCEIPLRFIGDKFEIEVTYLQPHFPGDIVGYIPIEPPTNPEFSKIIFTASSGRALKPKSPLAFLCRPRHQIEVIPKNRKLIEVKSVPKNRKPLELGIASKPPRSSGITQTN